MTVLVCFFTVTGLLLWVVGTLATGDGMLLLTAASVAALCSGKRLVTSCAKVAVEGEALFVLAAVGWNCRSDSVLTGLLIAPK